jgi:hypothetical protein
VALVPGIPIDPNYFPLPQIWQMTLDIDRAGNIFIIGVPFNYFYTGDSGNYANYLMYRINGISDFPLATGPIQTFFSNIGNQNFPMRLASYGKSVPFFNASRGLLVDFADDIGILAATLNDIAYSAQSNELWLVYTDIKPNVFNAGSDTLYTLPPVTYNMTVYTIYSRDGGMTWSQQIAVSDSTAGDRGCACMAIDPITDAKAFFFYDGRAATVAQPGLVQPYASVLL